MVKTATRAVWVGVALAMALAGCQPTWGSKGEERLCEGAIAGRVPWPSDACRAMSVCANAAQITEAQRATLARAAMEHRCAAF